MPKSTESKLTAEELQLLKQARDIIDVLKTPGWASIASFIQNSIAWPDPKLYNSREQVIIPYSEAYGAAELAKKIGYFVNSQEDVIKNITAKVDSEADLPNFKIGT